MGEGVRRLLIVDDDMELCAVLGEIAKEEGYQVTTTYRGTEFMARYPKFRPHRIAVRPVSLGHRAGYHGSGIDVQSVGVAKKPARQQAHPHGCVVAGQHRPERCPQALVATGDANVHMVGTAA